LKRAPLAVEVAAGAPNARPQPVVEKPREKPKEEPSRDNRALAAQARAEAELIAAKRAEQEKRRLEQEAKRAEQLAEERERARVVKEREKLAMQKLKRDQEQLQHEKAKAEAALRVEARRLHEQEERIKHQQRQLEWEREKQERRDELQKLRAASEEREKARAEEARKRVQEDREKRMAERERNRDRPWRVGSDKEEGKAGAGEDDPAPRVANRVVAQSEDNDALDEVEPKDGQIRVAKVQKKPAVPRQNADAPPVVRVNKPKEDNAHDLVVESALKRRERQDVDMEAARERREKFERMRAGGGKREESAGVSAGVSAGAVEERRGAGEGHVPDERKPVGPDPLPTITVEDSVAVVVSVNASAPSGSKENERKKKQVANTEWLGNLQDVMGNLKNQMNDLKSDNSRDSSSAREKKKALGFEVGNADKEIAENTPYVPVYMKKSKSKGSKKKTKRKDSAVGVLDQIAEEPPVSAEEVRRQKRDQESNDLRRFLKSQRKKQEKVIYICLAGNNVTVNS
jgi:hypothetical protein